jgi:hypothetical protein
MRIKREEAKGQRSIAKNTGGEIGSGKIVVRSFRMIRVIRGNALSKFLCDLGFAVSVNLYVPPRD